jgi:hypothetical protein
MSKFDFEKAFADAKADLNVTAIRAVVLGPSGAGKSSLLGTFKCKTLLLYCGGEDHGPVAAKALGGDNIYPICLDREGGENIDPDVAYQRLLQILSSVPKQFKAVAVDGATEVEFLIRSTKEFKNLCLTDKGKHNTFAESGAVLVMFRPIINELKRMGREGIHTIMTCGLDVSAIGENGDILESKPRLSTYGVAEGLLQQTPDYFCVGSMTNSAGKQGHRVQFMAGVGRESKDVMGVVKKTINFKPRLNGIINLPDTCAADLTEVIKLKGGAV